ncbi:hypothetical protein [Lentzea sp. E54]|uniref:hypothetical protein n=1 Tax=Lentzea xerophila TaxID=3435883 RepID=UPI003DA3B6A9
MPSPIRIPSLAELPGGPRRDLVKLLFFYYREAGRPTLRRISAWIDEHADELAGTASKETVRRMLTGKTVPAQWETAHTVFLALCNLAGVDPDDETQRYDSNRAEFKDHWNQAIDNEPRRASAFADEPPF